MLGPNASPTASPLILRPTRRTSGRSRSCSSWSTRPAVVPWWSPTRTPKERAADALRAAGWRVGMQSAGSEEVKALVAELVAGEINVLVGTDSVGTGIDVPGDALRLVVLLSPFNPNPFNDVFLDMWSMRFGYHRRWPALLNKMADEKMHQAIGRLLRTPTDRGVVAFIEPRPAHQSRFLSWVIPSTVTRDLADVERFFA